MIPQHNIAFSSPVVSELQSAHVVLAEVTRTGGASVRDKGEGFSSQDIEAARSEERDGQGNAGAPGLIIFDPGRARIRERTMADGVSFVTGRD